MATLPADAARPRLDIGRVIGRTLRVLRSYGPLFVLVDVLLVGAPQALSNWLIDRLHLAVSIPPKLQEVGERFVVTELFAITITALGAAVCAWIALVVAADDETDRPVDPLQIARAAAARAGPILTQGVLYGLGFLAGFCLLIVPGLMLLVAWVVSTPALAIEGLSPRQAFARSLELTRGLRWPIFGFAAAWFIPVGIASFALTEIVTGGLPIKAAAATPLVRYLLNPLTGSLFHAMLSVGVAALYIELVTIREGGLASRISEVFA